MVHTKGKVDAFTYDVFISHKSDCKPWVNILAQNLKNYGFTVFLDEWELVPGKSITEGLYRGLKQSRKGILVATAEAFESGWVNEEFHQMMVQKQENYGFSIIPVVLDREFPDFAFMKDILWVDFRDPARYREAFYRLVCAIEEKPPGPSVQLNKEPVVPEPSNNKIPPGKNENAFMDDLFEAFFTRQAVLLLARTDRRQAWVKNGILERAKQRFGEENVLHLVPPFGRDVDMKDYFALLGRQCGFSGPVDGSVSFLSALEERLQGDGTLFLLVGGFENSGQSGREQLAGVLRNLNERFPHNFKTLISGGEKLADIAYGGSLSLLNQAEIMEWPDMTVSDVRDFLKSSGCGETQYVDMDAEVDEPTAQLLLDVSGGHPYLLETCFRLHRQNPGFSPQDLTETLLQSPVLWRLFTPFNGDAGVKRKLSDLLKQTDVGPAMPFLYDPLLKRLYWRNLIKRSPVSRRLVWRCEALRRLGLQILEFGSYHE
jgi:hypothetical protein